MITHQRIWAAIDTLAEQNDVSVSRLARSAGLDPTTFNKSKRISADGRKRWPSTESIAKILKVSAMDWAHFSQLVSGGIQLPIHQSVPAVSGDRFSPSSALPGSTPSIPLIGFAEAGSGGFFDDLGYPAGHGWDEVEFPGSQHEAVYALEVSGDSMLPLYRDGDRIIVSPSASLRRGDRVVVRTTEGEVLAKVMQRNTLQKIELVSINSEHPDREFEKSEIDWIARIIWASQ